jgi:uncharacterized protein
MKKILPVFLVFLLSCTTSNTACISEFCFPIEIADTADERSLGLMFRDSLEGGMLFIYQDLGRHNFWMKNTLIPLDIIWMNEDLEVIYVESVQPCKTESCPSYGPDEDSMYVLELNIGSGVKVGDVLKIRSGAAGIRTQI